MTPNIPRAFLSHSSADKPFVSAVANRLGRHRVTFDQMHFETGKLFLDEIEKHTKSSSVFVFFASPKSLSSFWCTFEVDTARLALIQGILKRAVTYVISNTVKLDDIPEWLRQSRILFRPGVGQVVRDLDHHLMASLPSQMQPPFVGRNALRERFLESLVNARTKQVFAVSGLESIGRRSYVKRVLDESHGIKPGPMLDFNRLTGPDEIYAQLLTDSASYTATALSNELSAFSRFDATKQLEEVLAKLDLATGPNEYPIFVDHGGLTDKQGNFMDFSLKLIEGFVSSNDVRHMALIHWVKPRLHSVSFEAVTVDQAVPPLSKAESIGLLRRLLIDQQKSVTEPQLLRAAEMSDGFPPAVVFIARFIQKYGATALLNSSDSVIALKRKVFVGFLRELGLDDSSITILRYLAREGALSFAVIGAAMGESDEALAETLVKLIDFSLVIYDAPRYAIASPIRDSVERLWGELPRGRYGAIAANLAAWSRNLKEIPDVDTIDAILAAQTRGGVSIDWSRAEFPLLPSSLVKVCERCYHQREYEKASDLSSLALKYAKTRSQRLSALAVQAKSLVNMQKWGEADAVLKILDDENARERFYLRGFMLRKRRQFSEALEQYEKAIKTGHNPNSVLRDCADCLFRLGRFAEAIARINVVRSRDADNPWVLDLLARCYTDAKDKNGYLDAMSDLKACDKEGRWWHHREAAYLAKAGKYNEAFDSAAAACEVPQAPIECFALRVDVAVELGRFADAEEYLRRISERFGRSNPDIQHALWCKFYLGQKEWNQANSFWDKITEKELPVHRALRIRILEVKGKDPRLSLSDRSAALRQAQILHAQGGFTDTILTEDSAIQEN